MATFLVTYDLNKSGQDYPALYKAIEALGEHIHPMDSVWFVRSTLTAAKIRDELKKHVDSNDTLFVCGLSGWGSSNLGSINNAWIKGE